MDMMHVLVNRIEISIAAYSYYACPDSSRRFGVVAYAR